MMSGSKGLTSTDEQVHVGLDLLTMISYKYNYNIFDSSLINSKSMVDILITIH